MNVSVMRRARAPLTLAGLGLAALHCGAPPSTEPSVATDDPISSVGQTGPVHPLASSGLCLDVVDQSTANGAAVQVWACGGSAQANQQWTYDGTSLRVYGTKCLDVPSGNTTDGTKLQIWDCTPGNTNQMWTMTGGALQWTGRGRCLDLTEGAAVSGTKVQSWTCYAGSANQQWSFGASAPPPPPAASASAAPPPPSGPAPDFGPNVVMFDPSQSTSSMQSKIDSIYAQQDAAQFGSGRFAFFFKPGSYSLDVKVGFYTEVLGLGASPDDVAIDGAVRAKADWLGGNNATCNFWRGAENVSVTPSGSIDGGVNRWATSQGVQLRRLHVRGDLALDDGGWSSGGFIANSVIDGQIRSGTQQQYLTRNDDQNWQGSNWNMVFVGDGNAPGESWPGPPFTVASTTPRVREKPFLYLDGSGGYQVMVPAMKTNSRGHDWSSSASASRPISGFYVAKPGDAASTLNAALSGGRDLILTPGIYRLDAPIQVTRPGAIVLGLGLATISPTNATPAITVADVDGVTLGGLLLEAGPAGATTLAQVGPAGSNASHSANPTALFDVHCRVGGAQNGTAQSCVTVNSHDVILDDTWLWRADHGTDADWNGNRSANGLIVNGDNVTAYGLFVEHFQEYQTLWNGNGGAVYFYQSEMPYDPPNQGSWMASSGHDGYPSYKVADGVTSHFAEGIGVYSVFSNNVSALNAIESPQRSGVTMRHMMTVSLASGTIQHIVNGTGNTVGNGNMTAFSP